MIIYKGRKEYDFIVLTLKMSNYDDFLGVFKDKEDIAKYFESSSFNVEGGAYTGFDHGSPIPFYRVKEYMKIQTEAFFKAFMKNCWKKKYYNSVLITANLNRRSDREK